MTAPRTYFHTGRQKPKPPAVREVETLACDATLGSETHALTNNASAVTRCCWCGRTWAELDADVRGAA